MMRTAFCNVLSDDDEEHAVAYANLKLLLAATVTYSEGYGAAQRGIFKLPLQAAFGDAVGIAPKGQDGDARSRWRRKALRLIGWCDEMHALGAPIQHTACAMFVQEGEGLYVRKLMTHVSAECRVQGEVRVPTCQAFLTCVDGVGVILLAGKLDAFAVDESYELRSKAVEVAYEEIRLETCGKAMLKATINGDEEVVGRGRDRGDGGSVTLEFA